MSCLDLLLAAEIVPDLAARLAEYGDLVLAGNTRCNLTAARTPEALVPHILDSLTFLEDIEGPLVDVGSGGGFPAIPIAIATGCHVTMVESIAKKASFLQSVVDAMKLPAKILRGRAETFALKDEHRGQYRCATARAVASAPVVLEYLVPFLVVGGKAILQRGALDEKERQASADGALVLGGELVDERLLDGQRRLLFIRKVRPTPWRFPRKNGIPLKKPLCM